MLTLAAWGLVAALTAPQSTNEGTAVVFRPEIDLHRRTVDALEARGRNVVPLPLDAAWTRRSAPQRVIAIGDQAAARAAVAWPELPRAEVLTWSGSEARPQLRISAHPQAECTRDGLVALAGAGAWTVLASPRDAGAHALATALGATLVNEGPKAMREAVLHGKKIWLRADPQIVDPAWARYLGQVNTGAPWIGTDAPGLARFGLETPVRIDVDAVAQRVTRWMDRPSSELEEESAPCLAP